LEKYTALLEGLTAAKEEFLIERKNMTYRGRKKLGMLIKPISLNRLSGKVWIKRPKKIVLMSATIKEDMDVLRLGLGDRRILEFNGDSPIPVGNRPLKQEYVGKMSYAHKKKTFPSIVTKIKELADRHQGKGFIHATYALAEDLQPYLDDPRFIFHNKENKAAKLKKFMESKDKIFIGSGLSEGLSLNGAEYEWQVMTKVQFPSLADPVNKHNLNHNKDLYSWETATNLIQMYGRICRDPKDKGITYILDSSFKLFYTINRKLFPQYFQQAIKEGAKIG